MSWEPLGAVAPERLLFTRRALSSAARLFGDRRLVWDLRRRRLLEPFNPSISVRVGLSVSPFGVFSTDALGETDASLRLAGETPSSVGEWLGARGGSFSSELARRGSTVQTISAKPRWRATAA